MAMITNSSGTFLSNQFLPSLPAATDNLGGNVTTINLNTIAGTQYAEVCISTGGGDPCPPCAADYNQDDGVDDLDIAAFFADFESGEPCADVNNDDGIDDLDISFFFSAFEQGC